MKLNYVIGFIIFSMASAFCHASPFINMGQYSLGGTIKDGSRDKPGYIVETVPGETYSGLALDAPVNITHITAGMDVSEWPVLKRGRLDHMQMIMNRKNTALYKKYYGKHVVVDCFIDFAGRYDTPVFCGVINITPAPAGVASKDRSSRTAVISKKLSEDPSKTNRLFETLSYCVVPAVQYGQYSSYDGGKSSGYLLMDKCANEFLAWNKACLEDGGTKDSCLTEGLVYVQSILKKFNK
ncbi:MAG: hypothetical protein WC825_04320 [Gallionellaceae bacterium]|jgi:hypothetical protein